MTAILPRSEMPGFTHPEVDEALSPSSDVSYLPPTMMSNVHGMFPYSQAGAADILTGPTWGASEEGTQNFQDFHDNASVHPGDADDYGHYPFHGHMTPRGLGQDSVDSREDFPSQWLATHSVAASVGGEPMKRGASRSSAGSHKHRSIKASSVKSRSRLASVSQASSKLSKKEMTGNAFRDGSQVMDIKPQFPDSESSSQFYYSGLPMDLGMADGLQYPPGMSLHVAPSQMQYDPDTALTDSPVSSWDALSAVDSSISSPHEDIWSVPGASPPGSHNSSPMLNGQASLTRNLGTQPMLPEDLNGSAITAIATGEDYALGPYTTNGRRQSEGESARDHYLYKTAAPGADGLYHCPWEGDASCNHKPEKLKCNYDKFVDSHLKPYRCKIESCQEARFSSTACLLRHEREAHAMHGHGDKPFLCTYNGCDRAQPGNGFPRQWNLKDHMRRVHNDNGVPAPPTGAMTSVGISGSPILAAASHPTKSSKGRKRKTDAAEPSSGRKSSTKSLPVADSYKTDKAMERWQDHHARLQKLAKRLNPENPEGFSQIRNVLESMEEISHSVASSQKHGVSATYRRSYVPGS